MNAGDQPDSSLNRFQVRIDPDPLVLNELKPGETLIWSGGCKGKARDSCRASGPIGSAAGGAILGFILGILVIRIFAPNTPAVLLVSMPLGALVFVRGSAAGYRKLAAVHALTNRRLFSVSKLYRTVEVRSLPLEHIGTIFIDYRDYDRHTLHLHARSSDGRDSATPYLRFRLVSNRLGVLPQFQRLRPDVTIEQARPPSAQASQGIGSRLRRRH